MPALAENTAPTTIDSLRVPPHSLEAEQAVLGGLMLDPKAWDKVADRVEEGDFYRHDNRLIFRAIADLARHNQPFDAVTLGEWFDNHEKNDDIGGMATLVELANNTPSASHIVAYADIVRDRAVLRQLIDTGTKIVEDGYRPEGRDTKHIVEEAEEGVFKIARAGARGRSGFVGIRDAASAAMRTLQERYANQGELVGLPTGFVDLDGKTGGLQKSDLLILAGRPSMGKCLAADAELVLDDGSVATIEQICRSRGGRIGTLRDDYRLDRAQPSDFVDDGHKPTFEVVTRLGRRVEATAPHPFLTLDGWKPLHQLAPGDHVAVPRHLPVFGDQSMRACDVRLLAYLIGDGGLTTSVPRFSNSNVDVVQDFLAAIADFGGVVANSMEGREGFTPSWRIAADAVEVGRQRQHFATALDARLGRGSAARVAASLEVSAATLSHWRHARTVPDATQFARLCEVLEVTPATLASGGIAAARRNLPNPLTRWLSELGLMGKDAHAKQVPGAVFKLPRAQLALFLNRLFATDGWASVLASGQAQIGYASVSERLARQVQHLLLRFGVVAKLRLRWVRYRESRRPSWQLDVTNAASLRRFVAAIGIHGKQAAVDAVTAAVAERNVPGNVDHIPAAIWQRIAAAKGSMSWAELARRTGYNDSNSHVGRRAVPRERLARIAMVLDDHELAALAGSDVIWDRIESVVSTGTKQVYDLTVPGTHNFIANDVCVHNTALAVNIAESVVLRSKRTVGVFSMEMSSEQLTFRLLSSLARINQTDLRNGHVADEAWPRITSAIAMLSDSRLYIDDTPALSPVELRSRARRLHRDSEDGLGLIVIDYLQLMQVPGSKENRATEVSEISRSLKALAKELEVPVICLSQLNRALEQRNDKRPMMSDLRESGAIEQDADVIMFIYRDEYYHPDDSADKGLAEIIIGKQRNGPTGTIKLAFHGQYTRFESYTPESYEGAFE